MTTTIINNLVVMQRNKTVSGNAEIIVANVDIDGATYEVMVKNNETVGPMLDYAVKKGKKHKSPFTKSKKDLVINYVMKHLPKEDQLFFEAVTPCVALIVADSYEKACDIYNSNVADFNEECDLKEINDEEGRAKALYHYDNHKDKLMMELMIEEGNQVLLWDGGLL